MPKILKYNYVNIDNQKIEIDRPVFEMYENVDIDEELSVSEDETERYMSKRSLSAEEILEDAKMQAQQILTDAEIEAKNRAFDIENEIRQKAEEEAERIRSEAEEQGYEAGYEEGKNQAEGIKRDAEQTLRDAILEKERILDEIEPQMVGLMSDIMGKILNDMKVVNPQIILALIKKGLAGAKMTGEIFIHISDKEYDAVMQNKAEIPELNDPNLKIEVIKDYAMESGGCVIETEFGNIDCSIDEQLKKARECLYFILDNKK